MIRARGLKIVLGVSLSFFYFIQLAGVSYGADYAKPIPAGASFADVMALWGEPVEKVEEGVLRQTIWYYRDGARVTFKDGRARSFRYSRTFIAAQRERAKAADGLLGDVVGSEQVRVEKGEVNSEAMNIIKDIAKDVPSQPDSPYVEPPAAQAAPVVPPQQQQQGFNQMAGNPGNFGAPPGMIVAPGDDGSGEEE